LHCCRRAPHHRALDPHRLHEETEEAVRALFQEGESMETNRILGVLCRELVLMGVTEAGMPALKCLPQIVVQNIHPNLQQEVRTARCS
jgi:hypothetical protein